MEIRPTKAPAIGTEVLAGKYVAAPEEIEASCDGCAGERDVDICMELPGCCNYVDDGTPPHRVIYIAKQA